MPTTFVFDGLATVDAYVAPETTVECCADGLVLRHAPSGVEHVIPTARRPEPGCKWVAQCSLQPVFDSCLVARREVGGGAVRAGVALARRLKAARAGGVVHLLNSGTASPELSRLCAREGMTGDSLARQATPANLIVPLHNRIVIKGLTGTAPAALDDEQRQAVGHVSAHAGAPASVSSKDGALTAAVVGTGNGARRYFQPTGSLPPEMTHLLLRTADEAVCNFEEWGGLGRDAGTTLPDLGKESPEAPEAAAALLRALHRRRWAGAEAAVCTLGRRGSVVADWLRDRVYHVALESTDGEQGVPTPAGLGDQFLAEWIFLRATWSNQDHLRDPLAATCVRATYAVAQALRLSRDCFDVRVRQL
jgi:hypothetical protein